MWISIARSLNNTKISFPSHGNEGNYRKGEGEIPTSFNYVRKWRMCVNHGMGMHFLNFSCPISKKTIPKNDGLPNSNLTSILFQSQGINYLNQFLEEINDWVNKTKKVVDHFMGSPIDIWIYPIGSRVWIFPSPFLAKSCPHLFNVALT